MKSVVAVLFSLALLSRSVGEMVGRWAGDGDALDTASTNHGSLVNGAAYGEGRVNQAFVLDGSDDYVVLPSVVSFLVSNSEGSITAWVYPTAVGDNDVILACGSGGGGQGIGLGIWGNIYIYHHYGAYDWATSSPVSPNQWTFLAYTWNATTEAVYTNGCLSDSRPRGTFSYVPGHARIGSGFWGDPANYFPGKIDQLMLFNTALSSNQIAALASLRSTHIAAISLADSKPTLQITNITEGLDNTIVRCSDILGGDWTNVAAFVGRSVSTNWTDHNVPSGRVFYRVDTW